jgi:hypothetical protein
VIFGEYVMGMPYLKENKLLDMASDYMTFGIFKRQTFSKP